MRVGATHSKGCSRQSNVMPLIFSLPKVRTNPSWSALRVKSTAPRPMARFSRSVCETWGHSSAGEEASGHSKS